MKTYLNLGGGETLTLKGALLVYELNIRAFVSWHSAVHSEDGATCLTVAQVLCVEFVRALVLTCMSPRKGAWGPWGGPRPWSIQTAQRRHCRPSQTYQWLHVVVAPR